MAGRAVAGIEALSAQLRGILDAIHNLDARLADVSREVARLIAERDRALADLRGGFFCNQCNKTRSEFPSEQHFWAHIAEGAQSGRKAIPAPQSLLDAKWNEFAQKIAAEEAKRGPLLNEKATRIREAQLVREQLQAGVNLWRGATSIEEALIAAQSDEARRKYESDLEQVKAALRETEREREKLLSKKPVDAASLAVVETGQRQWREMKERLETQEQWRLAAVRKEFTDANAQRLTEFKRLAESLQSVTNFDGYVGITHGLMPVFSFSAGPVSLSSTNEQLGATFKFGSIVSSGITAGAEDATSTEVRTFLAIKDRLRLGVGWRTQYTADGVESGPSFHFEVLPGKGDGPAPKDTTKKDPQPSTTLPLP